MRFRKTYDGDAEGEEVVVYVEPRICPRCSVKHAMKLASPLPPLCPPCREAVSEAAGGMWPGGRS
jgi:uncharacterized metal-binding protein YceD (DUF177 family)